MIIQIFSLYLSVKSTPSLPRSLGSLCSRGSMVPGSGMLRPQKNSLALNICMCLGIRSPRFFLIKYNWSTSDFPGHKASPFTNSTKTQPEDKDLTSMKESFLVVSVKYWISLMETLHVDSWILLSWCQNVRCRWWFKEVFSANLNIEFWCKNHDFSIISCYFLAQFIYIESCTSWLYKLSSRSRSIERLESCPATLDCWKLVQLHFQVHFYSFLPFLEPYQGPMLLFIDLYDWVFKAEDLFLNFDKKVPTKPGKVWRWKVETFSSCNVSDCLDNHSH